MSIAHPERVDHYASRTPDADGWRGIPFRYPSDMQMDGGKHDGGPMPPEAPRDPQPSGGDGDE